MEIHTRHAALIESRAYAEKQCNAQHQAGAQEAPCHLAQYGRYRFASRLKAFLLQPLRYRSFEEAWLFRDERKVLDRRIAFFVDPATNIDVGANKVTTQRKVPTGSTIWRVRAKCATRLTNLNAAR